MKICGSSLTPGLKQPQLPYKGERFMESILKTLAACPAPSGAESRIREVVSSFFPAEALMTDAHGSLLFHKEGQGDGVVVLVAMDTPSLYVTYAEGGFARFSAVGGLKPADGMAVLCEGDIPGVIGTDSIGQFIDTGAHTLETGMWAVPVPSFHKVDDSLCFGASMGQYAAMCAAICAAKAETEKDVYFVFATKSHIRQLSPSFMQGVRASKLLSVEVSAANDYPAEKAVFSSLSCGTTLRVKDEAMLSSLPLLMELEGLGLKTYREVSTLRGAGGTVQKAYGGIESAGIGIPVRYHGTGNEMVSLSDIKNTADLIASFLK